MKTLSITLGAALAAISSAIACSGAPAKAPGSNPRDMSSACHRVAAQREQGEATEHERKASRVVPTKPAVEWRLRSEHERAAERHSEFARQHESASGAATGVSDADDCKD